MPEIGVARGGRWPVPVQARRCQACGKTGGCDTYGTAASKTGYWHVGCFRRARISADPSLYDRQPIRPQPRLRGSLKHVFYFISQGALDVTPFAWGVLTGFLFTLAGGMFLNLCGCGGARFDLESDRVEGGVEGSDAPTPNAPDAPGAPNASDAPDARLGLKPTDAATVVDATRADGAETSANDVAVVDAAAPPCGPSNCALCCLPNGTCGDSTHTCGSGGRTCVECPPCVAPTAPTICCKPNDVCGCKPIVGGGPCM